MRPKEFFTEEELAALLDLQRPDDQCRLLEEQHVPFVRDSRGRPLVYRDRLVPAAPETKDEAVRLDYSAARRRVRRDPEPR